MLLEVRSEGERTDEEAIAVFAPLGRDAELLCATLREADYPCEACRSGEDLVQRVREGVGALLLTNEALEQCDVRALGAVIRAQPPWSDLPVLFLAGTGPSDGPDAVAKELGNVLVVHRPTSPNTIVATVANCLRARRRQFAFRDLLAESEEHRAEISSLNERLVRAMRETHHRVKNNLQVVAALVDMRCMDGAEQLSMDEFRRIGTHVQTLAVVHDLLTLQARSDATVTSVSSREIFDQLLPKIQMTAPNCRMTFAVDEMELSVRQATGLSLVVFELVANAVKHGKGQASVELTATAHHATLSVTDDGNGFPDGFDPIARANTGLELVENLSRWDLRGVTRYETTPDGGRVCVTFPLDAAA